MAHQAEQQRSAGLRKSVTGGDKHKTHKSDISRHSDSKSVGTVSVVSFAEIAKQKLRKARVLKQKEAQLKAKEEEEK